MLGIFSNKCLDTCHPKLQRLIREVDKRLVKRKTIDITVLCGHRGQKEQEQAFRDQHSTKHWPESRHNTLPSTAVDVAPYPLDWSDSRAFGVLAGYILATADDLDIEVSVGALWKNFPDLPHVELTTRELNRP
jgi:peptidoglycan LD-endopeptidase CwlK